MSNSKLVAVIAVLVVIFLVAGFFGYTRLKNQYTDQLAEEQLSIQGLTYEKELLAQSNSLLKDEIAKLNQELENVNGLVLPLEKMEAALGLTDSSGEPLNLINLPFRMRNITPENQVKAFFAYLDQQPYAQNLKGDLATYDIFVKDVAALNQAFPNVHGETKSLFDMVKNISYFFRTVGKNDMALAKAALTRENDIMEPIMAAFYSWFNNSDSELAGAPDLKFLYEYSDYLLNSFGGRAYLVRRSAKVRLLTTYYCILVVDKANDRNENYNGIDIRPYIDMTLDDMRGQMGLINRDEYIQNLETLKTKYQRSNGDSALTTEADLS